MKKTNAIILCTLILFVLVAPSCKKADVQEMSPSVIPSELSQASWNDFSNLQENSSTASSAERTRFGCPEADAVTVLTYDQQYVNATSTTLLFGGSANHLPINSDVYLIYSMQNSDGSYPHPTIVNAYTNTVADGSIIIGYFLEYLYSNQNVKVLMAVHVKSCNRLRFGKIETIHTL